MPNRGNDRHTAGRIWAGDNATTTTMATTVHVGVFGRSHGVEDDNINHCDMDAA